MKELYVIIKSDSNYDYSDIELLMAFQEKEKVDLICKTLGEKESDEHIFYYVESVRLI